MNIVKSSIANELFGAKNAAAYPDRTTASLSAVFAPSGASLQSPAPEDEDRLDPYSTYHKHFFSPRATRLDYFTRRLPSVLRQYEFDIKASNVNKVFCSQWLDNRRVIMGTKCNKVSELLKLM